MPKSQGWGWSDAGRLCVHSLHTHCTLFLAHQVHSPQSQCLLLPTHKIPSSPSCFLDSPPPSLVAYPQLARNNHIGCRGEGGEGG